MLLTFDLLKTVSLSLLLLTSTASGDEFETTDPLDSLSFVLVIVTFCFAHDGIKVSSSDGSSFSKYLLLPNDYLWKRPITVGYSSLQSNGLSSGSAGGDEEDEPPRKRHKHDHAKADFNDRLEAAYNIGLLDTAEGRVAFLKVNNDMSMMYISRWLCNKRAERAVNHGGEVPDAPLLRALIAQGAGEEEACDSSPDEGYESE